MIPPIAWIQSSVSDTAVATLQSALSWKLTVDWAGVVNTGLKLLVILGLAWAAHRVLRVSLRRIERSVTDADPSVRMQEQRMYTLLGLVRSVGIVFIVVIAVFMALTAVGVNIGPLLAGAGVVGLAISFGAQSLVKDIISGLFILIENQFGVGDVIRIGGVAGSVEKMTLRIVVMRDHQGVVHIVPNGEIKQVSNLTRSFSRAVLDINVPYHEDLDRVMEVLREVGAALWAEPDWRTLLTEEPRVPGVETLGEAFATIRMVATTLPTKQWDVARELRRRIKRRFDDEGISISSVHRALMVERRETRPTGGARDEEEGADDR